LSHKNEIYDYAFIGMGCANSLLLLAMQRANLLDGKQIVIYEPEQKEQNDRTFCFWLEPNELKEAGLEELISFSWAQVKCTSSKTQHLASKRYYYLRSEALYSKIKSILQDCNATWIYKTIDQTSEDLAAYVFDSRPPQFETGKNQHIALVQSFYGWFVETEQPVFESEVFTMMDFSIPQNGHTQFLYVLPFDAHRALIEPTRFGNNPLKEEEAKAIMESYLALQQTSYVVIEKEQGCIPMNSAPILNEPQPSNWNKTGSGGGLLKPSTGYSFVRNLADAKQICTSLSEQAAIIARRTSLPRFAYFDRLLLQILSRTPHRGKAIFERLFAKNQTIEVLKFLDEETSPKEELHLMLSLPIGWFVAAAVRDFFWVLWTKFKTLAPVSLMALLGYFANLLGHLEWVWPLLAFGFLLVGLPHGALDHLHLLPHKKLNHILPYLLLYLALGTTVFALWFVAPYVALLFFLIYSAWHFGQADLQIWNRNSVSWRPFLWGGYSLLFLLATHLSEVLKLLSQMGLEMNMSTSSALIQVFRSTPLWMMLGLAPLYILKSWRVLEALLVLLLLSQLPLIEAFAIYFIFQHSMNGWRHLQKTLPFTSMELWLQALPFTLGSMALFAAFFYWSGDQNWGLFFMFLSALSFPHVYFMHRAYKR
jgi:lycopene beta-cyclase